jgi:catechol-2,3-dioxygenase
MTVDFDNVSGAQLRPAKLAHIVLRTADKTAMTKFYVDFLGGTVVHENEVLSFITYDDEHHRIALLQIPNLKLKDRGTCGLEVWSGQSHNLSNFESC